MEARAHQRLSSAKSDPILSGRNRGWDSPGTRFNIGLQYLRNAVAVSSEQTYASGFASWSRFRRLMWRDQYLRADATAEDNELAIVAFAAWCSASQGNQAGTIASNIIIIIYIYISAVQYFHRLEHRLELPAQSPTNSQKRIERDSSGARRRGYRPSGATSGVVGHATQEGGGRVLWLCLAMSIFLQPVPTKRGPRTGAGCTRPTVKHGPTWRSYSGASQLSCLHWRQADRAEARFRGHEGDQAKKGRVLMRTRDTVQGTRSGLQSDGAAVALRWN